MNDVYAPFPDDLLSNSEKEDFKFGQQVAEAIDGQWFNGNLGIRRWWIREMRSYSRGEQDSSQYKKTIEGNSKEDKESAFKTHKIDYKILKVLPNFKSIIVNAIDESLFKPRAEAIDVTAVNDKKEYFKKLDRRFYTKDIAAIVSQGAGIDLTQGIPQNEDELKVKKLEYKPLIEIAQEVAIENVLKLEKFEVVKDRVDEDLFDLGIGVLRHYTDPSEGIKIKYVDPYNYIHNDFEMEDGRDIRYHGVMQIGTIADIVKEANRELTQEELNAIKKYSMNEREGDIAPYDTYADGNRTIEYMSFAYLTRKERIYKKVRKNEKTKKLVDRSKNGYNTPNESKKLNIPYKVWFEGVYIPSCNILVSWNEVPNQIENEVGNPISPFLVYAPNVKKLSETGYVRFDSLVERAIPIVDDIHRDWYKFQQLKMELRPNTTEIDTDAINEVSLSGVPINAKDVLNLYFGRGILLKRTFNEDGDEIQRAVNEKDGGINNTALGFLANEFTNNYNRLRQLIGVNELRDGTTQPNSRTAVSVQKLLLASSNNATNHIVKASFALSLNLCESISYRLYDVLKHPNLKDRYLDAIGTDNMDILSEIKGLPMHKFAIYFDFKPANEERLAFEQSLIDSYGKGDINVAQYNKARQIKNNKSAVKYLEFCIDENQKKKQQETLMNIRAQAEAQAESSMRIEQIKQQTVTVDYEVKKELALLEDKLKEQQERRAALTKNILAEEEHRRAMELESLRFGIKGQIEGAKEDRKDQREDQRASNQAKLIDKRKNNIEPNFENEINNIFSQ